MNALPPALAWLAIAGVAVATPAITPAGSPSENAAALAPDGGLLRTAEELEQLVAPIVLYPDALIALILPASTAPADIVLAARQVTESGADRSQIEHRAWDESVKSLTYYPDVLKWLDENLQWTKQLGEAFLVQPADVMQAIQRLRAQARANGVLADTPQQQVLTDLEVIRIVPAQTDAIFVPYYEPAMFLARNSFPYSRPYLSFGVGLPVGSWLAFECDWRRHTIWIGNRHRHWAGHDWRRPVVPIPIAGPNYARHPDVRPWRPPAPPSRFPRSVPLQAALESSRAYAPSPALSPSSPSRVPSYHSSVPPRREYPHNRQVEMPASPAAPRQTPVLAVAPSARVSPNPAPAESPTPPPANTYRRSHAPSNRGSDTSVSTPVSPRRGSADYRTSPPAPATTVTAPPSQSPRYRGHPAATPPAAAPSSTPPPTSRQRSAPPSPSRPAAAPATAPASPPAAPPARTEVESERSVGRRSINER